MKNPRREKFAGAAVSSFVLLVAFQKDTNSIFGTGSDQNGQGRITHPALSSTDVSPTLYNKKPDTKTYPHKKKGQHKKIRDAILPSSQFHCGVLKWQFP